MTLRIQLGSVADIPEGEGRSYRLGEREVAVFRTRDGEVFATQSSCPHRKGPLVDGMVGGTHLVCPLHEWTFDLRSGAALQGECGIQVYPVTCLADGTMELELTP